MTRLQDAFRFLGLGGLLCYLLAGGTHAQTATGTATTQPLYEIGIVGIGGSFPDYPAASQNHWKGIVAPYLIYRGDVFKADETGLRGRLLKSDRVELNISVGGALPASSNDNRARHGMPDLDLMGEIGPTLRFKLARWAGRNRLDLDLPVRAVFTTDFTSVTYRGYLFQPALTFQRFDMLKAGSVFSIEGGPVFADQRLSDYFYKVKDKYAEVGRPAYDADPGYMGTRLESSFKLPLTERLSAIAATQLGGFWGAANDDSPLFKTHFNLGAALGLSYSFYRSDRQVPYQDRRMD